MYRLAFLLVALLSLSVSIFSSQTAAQTTTDEARAATVAVELSWYEAAGEFNALYDRIHPDAHAIVPRAAVIGWYQNEFAPRGPGVVWVTNVRFVTWTWEVTGQTYPYTAEVSFEQPFADGSILSDVVRLVQDNYGEWRWFFGRNRAFVEAQIARYAPTLPAVGSSANFVDLAINDIDTFWSDSFAADTLPYRSPSIVAVTSPALSECGFVDHSGPAAYCPIERTIYFSALWYDELMMTGYDFAWVTVIAHEWGHHIQYLLGISPGPGSQFELQADCLAGTYARDAATRGLLDAGDITEAVLMSAVTGDPAWLPQDAPGSHGTNDDRITAFMRGFLDGFLGCGLSV